MESRNHYHGIHPYAVRTVRHHARQMVKNPGFLPADVEDIEQKLMLDLHQRFSRFDSSKAGVTTFITMAVENHVASMLNGTKLAWNGEARTISLNEVMQDSDGSSVELIDTITTSQSPWNAHALSWHESIDLQADISRLLGRLPLSLRRIAEGLMEETVSELTVSSGIPRHALYAAIARIRSRFSQPHQCEKKVRQIPNLAGM